MILTLLNETTDAGKLILKAKDRNALAMANLTLALNKVSMDIVYEATPDNFKVGLAHLVIKGLFKKYRPQDTISRVELRMMLNAIKMKNKGGGEREDNEMILAPYSERECTVNLSRWYQQRSGQTVERG
jgi:hypothetical protein